MKPNHNLLSGLLALAALVSAPFAEAQDAVAFRDLVRSYAKSGEAEVAGQIAARIGVEKVDGLVALEYKFVQKVANEEKALDPHAHQFNIGDEVRVRIEPLSEMCLYVFHEGAEGYRTCLNDAAPLKANKQPFDLPAEGYYEFTPPPSVERLVVVATEKPNPALAGFTDVVFKIPARNLNPAQQQLKKKLEAVGRAELARIRARSEETAYRGELSDEALKKLGEGKANGVRLEEPPQDKTNAFAVAVTTGRAPSALLIDIPLRTVGAKK